MHSFTPRRPAGAAVLLATMVMIAMSVMRPGPAAAEALPGSYRDLVARLMPSVVNISTFKALDPTRAAGATRKASLGSGFIIDPAGIIVTNRHVVEGAVEMSVILHDNTILNARLVSWAVGADIALLQVTTPHALPAVIFGDSEKLQQGDQVLAIGNPLGFGGTVTTGIVSARSRDIKTSRFDDYIQTDASINPGNSGGPLFNLAGEVVGVATALYTVAGDGGSIGLGFAIPSFDAQFVIGRLRQHGRVRAGWLGVQSQALTDGIAAATGLSAAAPGATGVILTGVQPRSPGAAAGLEPGDVVLKVGDTRIATPRALDRAIGVREIGSTVAVTVFRPGGVRTLDAVIADDPEDAPRSRIPAEQRLAVANSPADAGLSVTPLTDELRRKFKLAADQRGMLVTRVAGNSVGSAAGLLVGDVVVSVERKPVATALQMQQAWGEARRQGKTHVLLLVQGANGTRWLGPPA